MSYNSFFALKSGWGVKLKVDEVILDKAKSAYFDDI